MGKVKEASGSIIRGLELKLLQTRRRLSEAVSARFSLVVHPRVLYIILAGYVKPGTETPKGIERGLRNPSLVNISRLAKALKVPIRELF